MKSRKKKEKHPTLFVLDGSIRYFENGTMLELYSKITQDEWQQIVEETLKYSIFVQCLKDIAFPILGEQWTKEDEWYRLQLEVAISRIRNLDALLVAKHNHIKIAEQYKDIIKNNATEVATMIDEIRKENKKLLEEKLLTKVSTL